MAAAGPTVSTPFAADPGQRVRFDEPDGQRPGPAEERKRMSTRLSSIVMDDAFDNLLPLSPSVDNFLNLATTCLNGQVHLPGRLFSSSGGCSLSGAGSLDLNWLVEGVAGDGAARRSSGASALPRVAAAVAPAGGRGGEGDCGGDAEEEGAGAPEGLLEDPSGVEAMVDDEVQDCKETSQEFGGGPSSSAPPHAPLSAAAGGGSFLGQPFSAATMIRPPAAIAPLPSPPPLHSHSPPYGSASGPVTSGAPGLASPGPFSSRSHSAVQSGCGEGGSTTPRTPHSTPTAAAADAHMAAVLQAEQQYEQYRSMLYASGGLPGMPRPGAPGLPPGMHQQLAVHAYQQQLLWQQAYMSQVGLEAGLQAQYSKGASDGSSEGAGAKESDSPTSSTGTAQRAGPVTPPTTPHTPQPWAFDPFSRNMAPLTPESVMAAAQQAQQAQQATDLWAQHAQQQMELWAQQAQQATAALVQACSCGPSAPDFGTCALGAEAQALQPPSLMSWAQQPGLGLMPTPFGPGQAPAGSQQGTCPFQLRVSTTPRVRVSTVQPVKLSQTHPTITFPPNGK